MRWRWVATCVLAIGAFTSAPGLSKDPGPAAQAERCRAAPGIDDDPQALARKLEECNGVLKPPRVGDPELVEPAPDVGRTPVIRPDELPPQQHGPNAKGTAAPEDVTVRDLVTALEETAATVNKLGTLSAPDVQVHDVSKLLRSDDAPTLDASLKEHQEDTKSLRQAIAAYPTLSQALSRQGLSVENVVAARINSPGSITIFTR
ncbi:hypothetical protein [Sinorhizobium sojae]|uniref:hypothetical protein n=1 Tax=Sinorhizobium sojae TaxID=716925 RepID=UPI001872AC38|nr:hypothetical protein [Sinorhizobium sojae]